MKTNELKDMALLAFLEISGFLLLIMGGQALYPSGARMLSGVGSSWAVPLIVIGSVLLCAGIVLAIKLIVASTKTGSDPKSESNNTR